eukprot:g16834.t1
MGNPRIKVESAPATGCCILLRVTPVVLPLISVGLHFPQRKKQLLRWVFPLSSPIKGSMHESSATTCLETLKFVVSLVVVPSVILLIMYTDISLRHLSASVGLFSWRVEHTTASPAEGSSLSPSENSSISPSCPAERDEPAQKQQPR